MSYQQYGQKNQFGCFATKDIEFIQKNNIYTPETIKWLEQTKNDMDPFTCLKHRRVQEDLRDNYNYYSSQKAWNSNNTVLHTFAPEKMFKTKK